MLSARLKLPPRLGCGLLRKMRIRDSLLGEGLGRGLTPQLIRQQYPVGAVHPWLSRTQ